MEMGQLLWIDIAFAGVVFYDFVLNAIPMDSHSCELFRIILLVSFTTVFKPGADVVRLPSSVRSHFVDVP
jgi:hypothetical protein